MNGHAMNGHAMNGHAMSAPATVRVNGEAMALRLTLGALAEIEEALGGDVSALAERLKRPRVADILLILRALIAGGGAPVTLDFLRAADIDLAEAARAVAEAFSALERPEEAAPGKPQGTDGPRGSGAPSST